jgi:hypothetical protein
MKTKTNVDALAKELQGQTVGREKAIECLHHPAALVRVNAIWAIGRMAPEDPTLLVEIQRAFEDPLNQTPLLGGVKVAHIAVEALVRIGSVKSRALALALLEKSGPDRDTIIWHLQSEGLKLP